MTSIPNFLQIDPRAIPWQWHAIKSVISNNDKERVHEYLFSGAVGSAKSVALAHLIVRHCLRNNNAVVGIGRLAMPHLKSTLLQVILDHIPDGAMSDYNKTSGQVTFYNGSKIIPFSWQDRKFKKFRSYEFSAFAVDELTENEEQDFYEEMKMRVGRLTHVPISECFIASATNPDDPSHWAYKYFIDNDNPRRHVFYSKTIDNPFLPAGYHEQLAEGLDPKMYQRMCEGKWLSIQGDVVYYAYDPELNFVNQEYQVNGRFPIHVSFDFNIGDGKPFSVTFSQYRPDLYNGSYHFYGEVVVEGLRTEDALEEALGRGLFDHPQLYIVNGDATGGARTTNSKLTNYEIIKDWLSNIKRKDGTRISFQTDIPRSNPPVRERHTTVNAMCCNQKGERRLFVYSTAPTLHEGMKLTKLVKGGRYVEDDSKYYQHCTTTVGYMICATDRKQNRRAAGMVKR